MTIASGNWISPAPSPKRCILEYPAWERAIPGNGCRGCVAFSNEFRHDDLSRMRADVLGGHGSELSDGSTQVLEEDGFGCGGRGGRRRGLSLSGSQVVPGGPADDRAAEPPAAVPGNDRCTPGRRASRAVRAAGLRSARRGADQRAATGHRPPGRGLHAPVGALHRAGDRRAGQADGAHGTVRGAGQPRQPGIRAHHSGRAGGGEAPRPEQYGDLARASRSSAADLRRRRPLDRRSGPRCRPRRCDPGRRRAAPVAQSRLRRDRFATPASDWS